MQMNRETLKKAADGISALYRSIPRIPRSILVTVFFLAAAYLISDFLLDRTGAENNSSLVFVLAVVFICMLTDGYFWGILASVIGALCTNTFFMPPYAEFSLSQAGYPVAMISMITISVAVSALTSRLHKQAETARRREQAARELMEQNQKLAEEKAEIQLRTAQETIRSNILRAVSHDLRTPLTAISGTASVLLSTPEVSPRNVSMLQDIKNDADTLINMVENLLSVTRIEGGTVPLKKRPEMLEEVAGDAVLTVRRRYPYCGVELELSEDLLYLPMESMLIKQVIFNLVENAIKHSGDTQHIIIRLLHREHWAVVEVQDAGTGLTEEVLQAIREGTPLEVGSSADSTRGMGIGLSVCQSIIKAHEGFFEAENVPEGGALFRFGLPMEEEVPLDE